MSKTRKATAIAEQCNGTEGSPKTMGSEDVKPPKKDIGAKSCKYCPVEINADIQKV